MQGQYVLPLIFFSMQRILRERKSRYMARTSPVHYIAPSAISITPNANNSSNDLAVYVAKGAKIKVHSNGISQLGFDLNTNTWQEWTMSGRNRRLNQNYSDRPFTIYARLRKTDKSKGCAQQETPTTMPKV